MRTGIYIYLAVTAKRNRRSTASDLSRQLSSATGTTVSRQTVYRHLGHIGLYARRPVRCVQLTTTHCRLRLTWSREDALWTPQQWSYVMFSDESRFSLQSDSRRTLIWRAPGTRYHQENTIERHRYGGAGWLAFGEELFLVPDLTCMFRVAISIGMSFWNNMYICFGASWVLNFCLWMTTPVPHRANIVDECLQSEDITSSGLAGSIFTGLKPIEHVRDMLGRRITAHHPLPPVYRNFGGHCLRSGVIFPRSD
ncbi:transposable element Tcb1 transposase [Trichonephila clavipes]|nr:transposable element Tcb1 transposase [Trichonephila clavipes]